MAKVGFVSRHGPIALISQYCEAFGRDPDEVFNTTSMGTVMNFLVYFKDMDEYQERFSDIWQKIQNG